MKVEIEEYRGWTISFDTEHETFYCHSEQWDRDENKKSFAATKKWIDDFIKENQTFKPVWVEKKPSGHGSYSRVKLIGIRKDGRFVYEDEKGDKKQLSEYDEKYYILYDERNDKIKEEAEKIASEIKLLRKKEEEILSSIVGISLSKYKKQIDL
jgi:hypothetical protein